MKNNYKQNITGFETLNIQNQKCYNKFDNKLSEEGFDIVQQQRFSTGGPFINRAETFLFDIDDHNFQPF